MKKPNSDMKKKLNGNADFYTSKIKSRKDLAPVIKKLKKEGKKIGVTNGVFDVLHAGHVDYLNKAKQSCDVLVLSLNTDASVKKYKDPGRPLNSESDRANVIAALSCIDYVTFHNERRMKKTLLALKPDLYIKAGDYKVTELTSRDVLKAWGGEVLLIPPIKGYSTTKFFEKVVNTYAPSAVELPIHQKKQKVIFLDRDGVINEEEEYVHTEDKFKFLPDVFSGVGRLQKAGFKIVVVTNQAGIGLGYFTKEDFFRVNKKMLGEFDKNNISISKIYFCPHSKDEGCICRKPQIGMLKKAQKDLNIELKKSWVIGDKEDDILMGKKAGCKTILVLTGHGKKSQKNVSPDFVVSNLSSAADIILKHS